jgi:hypothetical protein
VIPLFSSFQTKLAGVTFGDCQDSIRKWGHQDIGYFSLEREPKIPTTPTPSASGFSMTGWVIWKDLSLRNWLQ